MRIGALAVVIVWSSAALAAAPQRPTFSKDVAPILYANCVSCHRPGEVAPFPLLNYADAKKRAGTIDSVVSDRFMPPWKAEPGHGDFLGERRLSDEQVATISNWVKNGAPEGNPKDLPPQPKFTDGWALGQPDLVIKMSEAYTVPAEGRDVFRVFVIPMDIPEDKYVSAVEYRPGNRKVVHHALFFLDTTGKARELDALDPQPGYGRMGGVGFTPTGGLGGWAPGIQPERLPDGLCRPVKKGSDLVLQVHFHPSGKEEVEQSTIGLYFTDKPKKILRSFPLMTRRIDIPPGETKYTVTQSFTTPFALELVGLTPHAHLLCKEMKVWMTPPKGERQWLIYIKDWDFNWQDQYLYKNSIKVPAGTRFEMEYIYDNSAANPRNPSDPPKRVTFGEQTTNEMAITFLHFATDKNGIGGMDPERIRDILRRMREQQNSQGN